MHSPVQPQSQQELSPLQRMRRGAWSGLYGGAVAGTLLAMGAALYSSLLHPGERTQAIVLLLMGAFGALAGVAVFARLGKPSLPYWFAPIVSALLAMEIAALIPLQLYANTGMTIGHPPLFGLFFGGISGALIGMFVGAAISLLPPHLLNRLLPWGWLLGSAIAAMLWGINLLRNAQSSVPIGDQSSGLLLIPAFALAGWIAQNEYRRLRLRI